MNAILILFLFGIVLLVCEVFVPGAILGSIGGLAMLAGCISHRKALRCCRNCSNLLSTC